MKEDYGRIFLLKNMWKGNVSLECVTRLEILISGPVFLKLKTYSINTLKKRLGDGKNTRFWEDWWVGSKPLKEAYPSLYFISNDHGISVSDAIDKGWSNFSFRRTLHGELIELWTSLALKIDVRKLWCMGAKINLCGCYLLTENSLLNLYTYIWSESIVVSLKNFFGRLRSQLKLSSSCGC